MNVDYEVLRKFTDVSELDAAYHEVVNNIIDIDIEYGIDIIFKYYRKHGFPYVSIREDEKHDHMRKLQRFDIDGIFMNNKIIQTMHALRLAWTYFPHWADVQCGNSKLTPMTAFLDDSKFRSIIRKCWKWCSTNYGDNESLKTTFHENRLRQSLKIYTGVQAVSNFRPTAAKVIYENFGGDGVIWDMSCGWGGRLLGFLSAKNTKQYIGTEPSTKTFAGLLLMKKDFSYLGKQVDIYCKGSEEFQPKEKSLDLCFTSPPYFDTEKYADEDTQSFMKYPTQSKWINGFLQKTIENCHHGLKEKGYMLINIANTPKYKFIEEETIRIAKNLGFKQEETIELTLSSIMGAGYKYEPIFVFKK